MSRELPDDAPWYSGISRYQWTVLIIASLGWVFDIFEGQIFVASSNDAMPSFIARELPDPVEPTGSLSAEESAAWEQQLADLKQERDGLKQFYNNIAFAAFLLGGAFGGIVFGMLSDRIGRKKTMTLTIIFYSLFTCVSAFSVEWWHLAALRFLVAMGVGGEWAVASALVFEEFPKRARAHVGGIFHASSVLGTYLAVAATTLFIGNAEVKAWVTQQAMAWGITDPVLAESVAWRIGFALGAVPALLIIWIRSSLKEPEEWEQAKAAAASDATRNVGRIGELFQSELMRNTLVGFVLAAVGMATFWGVHVHGKEPMKQYGQQVVATEHADWSAEEQSAAVKRWEMLGMFLVTTGGGLGLIGFGPISQRLGRRPAFLLYHLGGLLSAGVLFGWMLQSPETLTAGTLYWLLPVFGFLTLGMHAGYAIYFPELFPTRLRGTGSGFCFNGGRIAAAPILFLSGWLQKGLTSDWLTIEPIGLAKSCLLLSSLYLVGVLILAQAPETRTREAHS
ncbi:MAG: MFS transporter [Planctomycetaceae bacterium]|nr:MFS transporter [Planctomycetaceae bacterium]